MQTLTSLFVLLCRIKVYSFFFTREIISKVLNNFVGKEFVIRRGLIGLSTAGFPLPISAVLDSTLAGFHGTRRHLAGFLGIREEPLAPDSVSAPLRDRGTSTDVRVLHQTAGSPKIPRHPADSSPTETLGGNPQYRQIPRRLTFSSPTDTFSGSLQHRFPGVRQIPCQATLSAGVFSTDRFLGARQIPRQ